VISFDVIVEAEGLATVNGEKVDTTFATDVSIYPVSSVLA